jgi:ABC-type transport system substrate-binding protein
MRSSRIIALALLVITAMLVAACQASIVEVTRMVTQNETITEQIEVTRIVEGETITEIIEVTSTPPPRGGRIVLGTNKFPSSMDPHRGAAWDILYVLSNIYDTLVYQDEDGKFVPGLATDWQLSNDGLSGAFPK